MYTSNKAFRSLQAETLTTKPLSEVAKWIENFVNLLFPDNGIEYWSDGSHFVPNTATLVDVKGWLPSRPKVACFVHVGNCEGRRIVLALCSATEIRSVVEAKSFGTAAECWAIAELLADSLECIVHNERQPRLVDMAISVPRSYSFALAKPSVANLLLRTEERAVVVLADGNEIDRYSVDRTYGDHEVDALEHDWKIVAGHFRLPISCERCKAPELEIGALP